MTLVRILEILASGTVVYVLYLAIEWYFEKPKLKNNPAQHYPTDCGCEDCESEIIISAFGKKFEVKTTVSHGRIWRCPLCCFGASIRGGHSGKFIFPGDAIYLESFPICISASELGRKHPNDVVFWNMYKNKRIQPKAKDLQGFLDTPLPGIFMVCYDSKDLPDAKGFYWIIGPDGKGRISDSPEQHCKITLIKKNPFLRKDFFEV